jgi:hypothetical protein
VLRSVPPARLTLQAQAAPDPRRPTTTGVHPGGPTGSRAVGCRGTAARGANRDEVNMRSWINVGWVWPLCAGLTACTASDGNFLAIEALPPPITSDIGLPLRITAVGGRGVQLDLTMATFDEASQSQCLTVGSAATDVGSTRFGTLIVLVHPQQVEAIVVGHLYASCPTMAGAIASGSLDELASFDLTVHVEQPNHGDAGAMDGGAL